jgi:hypothetical protein
MQRKKFDETYFNGLFDCEYEKGGHVRLNSRFYQGFDSDALEIRK